METKCFEDFRISIRFWETHVSLCSLVTESGVLTRRRNNPPNLIDFILIFP